MKSVTVAMLNRDGAVAFAGVGSVGLRRLCQPTSTATKLTAATRTTTSATVFVGVPVDCDGTGPDEKKHGGLTVLFKANV